MGRCFIMKLVAMNCILLKLLSKINTRHHGNSTSRDVRRMYIYKYIYIVYYIYKKEGGGKNKEKD